MLMVILFIKLERPNKTGKGRKWRWLIARQSNTVSEFEKRSIFVLKTSYVVKIQISFVIV